jgi:hypothetical protein
LITNGRNYKTGERKKMKIEVSDYRLREIINGFLALDKDCNFCPSKNRCPFDSEEDANCEKEILDFLTGQD